MKFPAYFVPFRVSGALLFVSALIPLASGQISPEAFVSIQNPTGVYCVLSATSTRTDGAVFTYLNFNTSELDVIAPALSANGSFSGVSPITGRTVSGQIQGSAVSISYNGITSNGTKESVYGPTRQFSGTYVGPIFHPTLGAASMQLSCSRNGTILAYSFFETQVDAGIGTIQPNGDYSVRLLSGRTASGNFAPANGIARGNAQFSTGETQTYALAKTGARKLYNISTRGLIGTGQQVLIGGFIITDSGKTVLVNAKGPSLSSSGITSPAQDPKIDLFLGNTLVASNSSWMTNTNAAQIAASGVGPTDSREAALQLNLEPGAYTVVVSAENGSAPGVGIVEVFDVGEALGD